MRYPVPITPPPLRPPRRALVGVPRFFRPLVGPAASFASGQGGSPEPGGRAGVPGRDPV